MVPSEFMEMKVTLEEGCDCVVGAAGASAILSTYGTHLMNMTRKHFPSCVGVLYWTKLFLRIFRITYTETSLEKISWSMVAWILSSSVVWQLRKEQCWKDFFMRLH